MKKALFFLIAIALFLNPAAAEVWNYTIPINLIYYTEVDPGSKLTVTSYNITTAAHTSESSNIYKNSPNGIVNFNLTFDSLVTTQTGDSGEALFLLGDNTNNQAWTSWGTYNGVGIWIDASSGAFEDARIVKYVAGAQTRGAGITGVNVGTRAYYTFSRNDTYVKLSIFSDAARTTHLAGSPQTMAITNSPWFDINFANNMVTYAGSRQYDIMNITFDQDYRQKNVSWNNNYTNTDTLNFSIPSIQTGRIVNFSFNNVSEITAWTWYVNGINQSNNNFYLNYNVGPAGNYTIIATAPAANTSKTWNIQVLNFSLEHLTPANGSTAASPVTMTWREWPTTAPHTYQISSDYQFINIVLSGTANNVNELYTITPSLDPGFYYWHVKNTTGNYSNYYTFTVSAPAATPGRFNITAFDEQTGARVSSFSAQIYNQTTILNKSTTTGWVNYSESEVGSGQYLIRIIPNNSYASRSVLATSPTNVSVWLPATSNTIDTIAFYLLDYTNNFPWDTSYLSLTKNNTVMHSAYFDADAKVAAYLIRGESYGITITNGNSIHSWGNYISTASGNVEVVIMNIGVNSTLRNPFVYNVTWNSNDIILQWSDSFGVMTSLNYSIYKGSSRTLVHQLITSVNHGSSDYIVTNTSDVYYVSVSALTTNGYRNQSYVIDYRSGQSATAGESPELYNWSYGSVTIPEWVKNAFAVLALMILAGSFGAMHRGEGAIITGVMSLIFWKWSWLSATGAGVGFLGALVLFAVLYHLDTKRKGGGYF